MFRQTWNKYIPVMRILIKRSATGEQSLSMNGTDFTRAAGGKKVKFSFDIELKNAQFVNASQQTPLVQEFILALQEDEQLRKLIRHQQLGFTMSNNFQLRIRNNTPAPPPGITISSEDTSEPIEKEGDTKAD
jgi:hypothetical protein